MHRTVKRLSFLVALLLGMIVLLGASDKAGGPSQPTGAFQPELVTSNGPICASLLPDVRKAYLTQTRLIVRSFDRAPSIRFRALAAVPTTDSTLALELPPDDPGRDQILQQLGGPPIYTRTVTLPGCGGACEGSQVLVSGEPIPEGYGASSAPGIAATPGFGPWQMYVGQRAKWYLVGVVDNQLLVYRVVPPPKWKVTCGFSLAPYGLSDSTDSTTRGAAVAVKQLTHEVLEMEGTQPEGVACGDMDTTNRWTDALEKELPQTLYRPWAVTAPSTSDPTSANSYGVYSEIIGSLRAWSASGTYESQAFKSYEAQFDSTVRALRALYVEQYGWTLSHAQSVANEKLRDAVSYGFGFYDYVPPDDLNLRQIVLQHGSLTSLRSASLSDLEDREPGTDPLISTAINYPAAVALLLKKGVNPDSPNDFGKTPLMYAAQYNQLASAHLLLKGGANPNAATIQPSDGCFYALHTTNVTALDYAIRYATPAMVKLLLAHGAVTFIRSQGYGGEVAGYPLDWLHKYADPNADSGSNPYINALSFRELEPMLQVRNATDRQRQASHLVDQAESLYASGKPKLALQRLQLALEANFYNKRAIADLPLVALRAGEPGVAVEGATRAVTVLKTPAARAAALFNEGLACEQANNRTISYKGQFYCLNGPIPLLLEAWQAQPTPERLARLIKVLQSPRPEYCVSGSGPSKITYQFLFYSGPSKAGFEEVGRIYVLHGPNQQIAPASIEWDWGRPHPPLPQVIARIPLGTVVLTVLQMPANQQFGGKPKVNGQTCTL